MEKYLINKPGKYDVKLQLTKEGEKLEWLGIIDAREVGEYELNLVTEHMAPGTFGRITVRGVAENGAKIRVKGLVRIENAAQNTDSFLAMKALLLDKQSGAVAEPELEILANRVKASHAASVGKIDEEQMLYLKSRGINEQEAKNIIIKGFLT
jgi:Fe-S cluster assembly scaffold protein SufB